MGKDKWTYKDEEAYEAYARRYRRLGVASGSTETSTGDKSSVIRGGVRPRKG